MWLETPLKDKIRSNFIDTHTGDIPLLQQQAAHNEVDKRIQI